MKTSDIICSIIGWIFVAMIMLGVIGGLIAASSTKQEREKLLQTK